MFHVKRRMRKKYMMFHVKHQKYPQKTFTIGAKHGIMKEYERKEAPYG